MSFRFRILMTGGPYEGEIISRSDYLEWPPPGILGGVGGSYVKVLEDYTETATAHYRWLSEKEIQEARNAKA